MWNRDFKPDSGSGHFHLDKWYLDFAGDEGEAMIFYAAKLSWRGFEVHYTSWLKYDPIQGVSQRSAFRNIHMPEKTNGLITWSDEKFGIWGRWEAIASPLSARLYDSDSGYLEWKCYQPASRVELVAGKRTYKGTGYAEQLILTVPPWKMPLHELRWGRFGSREYQLVWIEIRE
ncbi:MAG: hypothetical protein Q8908_15085, partial [Bacteroidota bacterium]|nr:hypothetical protein [Bacteroidota bacterium]